MFSVFREASFVRAQATNIDCASADSITSLPFGEINLVNDGSTTTFVDTSCNVASDSQSLWYEYTPTTSHIAQANVLDQSFSANLAVFSSSTGCSSLTCVGSDGILATTELTVEWIAEAGTTYYIVVSEAPTISDGTFVLSVVISNVQVCGLAA